MKITTPERLMRIETKFENMANDIGEIKKMLHQHVQDENGRFTGLDKKFASKMSERVVYGTVSSILLYVLALFLKGTIVSVNALSSLLQ